MGQIQICIHFLNNYWRINLEALQESYIWSIFYKNDLCAEYNILSSHTQIVVSQSNMQLHERLS